MCGILGLVSPADEGAAHLSRFESALGKLDHRGPDHKAHIIEGPVALGHTRLSIIDLDPRSHQPMTDPGGRYTVVFNGEIYNYRELRAECENRGYRFRTQGDTEVLLALYSLEGEQCLQKLNGFFAFAVLDRHTNELLLARDRFGIKPLVYHAGHRSFAFASEMSALLDLRFDRHIDKVSLFTYFKLNYIPAPYTILKNHFKLEPGHMIRVKWNNDGLSWQKTQWYGIPYDADAEKRLNAQNYKQAQENLKQLIRESVQRRMVADVPLATFLSGGVDSSIITAVASDEKRDLQSFSIGFPDTPYFDESAYARKVALRLKVNHHTFYISQDDLLHSANQVLGLLDEPFADSSALNVYLLSERVRKHVKVALSGDGGDELFGGYHKHQAEFRVRFPTVREELVGRMHWLWSAIPSSRSGPLTNLARQLEKFADGYQLGPRDRYWRWAGILNEEQANYLLWEEMLPRVQRLSDDAYTYKKRKDHLLRNISRTGSLNEVLLTDMNLVLPNDMLFKVDHMSMAHNLEVRTPLLDHHIVKFAFGLPVMYKVNHKLKKKILCDTYRDRLPAEVFNRPKKGFEVPLQNWFDGAMKARVTEECTNREFIHFQGLFNQEAIDELYQKLYSRNPQDSAATVWAFLVFQSWYKRYMV